MGIASLHQRGFGMWDIGLKSNRDRERKSWIWGGSGNIAVIFGIYFVLKQKTLNGFLATFSLPMCRGCVTHRVA